MNNDKIKVECVYCSYETTVDSYYLSDTEFINCPKCGKVEFFIKEDETIKEREN